MKRSILAVACLLGSLVAARAQTFTLTVNAGVLRNGTGTAVEPTGGLLQILASPSGTFANPTSSSYVGGDNVLVQSLAMNFNGGNGFTVNTLTGIPFTTANYTLTVGEKLLLRFYPSLTLAGMPAAPTALTTFGQVRSDTVEFGGTVDPSETPWVVPAAGGNKDFNYVTAGTGAGGTYPDGPNGVGISSFATFFVTPVPEPSTYAALMCGFACLTGLRFWKRAKDQLRLAA